MSSRQRDEFDATIGILVLAGIEMVSDDTKKYLLSGYEIQSPHSNSIMGLPYPLRISRFITEKVLPSSCDLLTL